ncbi:MAG: hypothetical protein ACREFP_26690 [Acetobacteraceae bacterium]
MIQQVPHDDAFHHRETDRLYPVSGAEVWRMVKPWLGYVFLAAAAVLGLFTASRAGDDTTYGAGLALFILAAIVVAWRMRRQLDGREVGFLLAVSVENSDSLLVSIAVLAVLGLVGIGLAAAVGGTLYGIGLALFVIAAALIFNDIKRYFDHRDAG